MKKQHNAAMLLLATLAGTQAWAAGDAKKGADVFAEECGDCHSVVAGKMKYDGLGDAAARADVIAYLMSLK